MKKMFKLTAVLALVLFTACASNSGSKIAKGDKALPTNPEILSGKLDNGMSYFILQNGAPLNRISLRLVVKVGSIAEEENQLGVAHFIEHMAFNGTEHFEKNTLIDYAESIGMDFGAEVNAYTSFEETVYKLEVPADKKEYLETALLIFKDWASAISFDQEELDKERGVITEEWRGRLGLSGRLVDAILPFELADSEYVGKLPIGSMDVIANITRDEVLEFYKKWYRPENISIAIAGTVDPKVVEWQIKNTMADIPASDKKITPPKGLVPARTAKDAIIFTDPEMPYTQVQIFAKDEDYRPAISEGDIKTQFLTNIVSTVLNQRLSEITADPQTPWLTASAVNAYETDDTVFRGAMFVPKEGQFANAFQQLLDEIDRLLTHGITQTEFDRAKESMLSTENQWYDEREAITNQERVDNLVNYCLTGAACISDDDYIEIARRLLAAITLDEANKRAFDIYQDRGNICMIYAPAASAEELPSKEEVLGFWENYKSDSIAAYEDNVGEGDLMERPAKKAEILAERDLEGLKATEYTLSNGAKIIIKPSTYEKSKIIMEIVSKGGASLVSDDEWMSCIISPIYSIYSGIGKFDITQLQKYLADKYVSINLSVDERQESITGQASPAQIECLLQLVNQVMTQPNFTDQGWYYTKMLVDQQAKMYNVQPNDCFLSEIRNDLYNGSIRHSAITPQMAEQIDAEVAQKLFRERYANAADFTYIFYGDIDEEALIDLCCYYIGTLKGNPDNHEDGKYQPYTFPKGITEKVVKKGQEDKGQVFIAFGGKLPPAADVYEIRKDNALMEQFRALVDIKLREIIREDKSGTYGVSVYARIDGYPERYYELQISFGCEPAREKELAAEVIAALEGLRTQLVDQTYIDKINESYRRNFEANQQDSGWWLNVIKAVEVFTYLPVEAAYDDTSVIKWTTAQSMREIAQKYLNTKNYYCAFLQPEK